jgi:peptidoglycan/LPS O-acetylase OafA/YrhL
MMEVESGLSGEAGKSAPAVGAGRIQQLDFLRGVAILLVLVYHWVFPPSEAGLFRPIMEGIDRFGWSGVDLFFVLSGFLIGGLLFKEIQKTGRLDVKRFLIRRGLKIWPPYFALVGYACFKMLRHGDSWHQALRRIWPNLLHVQNYFGTVVYHTWSIAVEEHFYLALPIILLILLKRGRNGKGSLAVVPWIAPFTTIVWLVVRFISADRFKTHTRGIDALFLGVTLAYFHCYGNWLRITVARYSLWLLMCGALLELPFIVPRSRAYLAIEPAWLTISAFGWALILVAILYAPVRQGPIAAVLCSRFGRIVSRIGLFSYGIYLWHIDLGLLPVQYWVGHRLRGHLPPTLWYFCVECLYLTSAILAGVVTTLVIEWPMLRLRDRLFPARMRLKSAPASVEEKRDIPPVGAESNIAQVSPA